VAGAEEFIIYSLRNSVYRYIFGTQQTELVASGLQSTVSVEYDYNNNCAYWADVTLDIIQVSENGRPFMGLVSLRFCSSFPQYIHTNLGAIFHPKRFSEMSPGFNSRH
jgi:hypothetical protein